MWLPSSSMTADAIATPEVQVRGASESPWLTARETAQYLKLSPSYTRQLIAEGRIRSAKVSDGRPADRRVHRDWADEYLQARATGGPAPRRTRARAAKSA